MTRKAWNWSASALTGGGVDSLDSLPYASMQDNDFCYTPVPGDKFYIHYWDAASVLAESSPSVIRLDDDGGGAGRFRLFAVYLGGNTASELAFPATEAVQIGGSGILALSSGSVHFCTVSAESGVTDDLVQITGLGVNSIVYLCPATGHTITAKTGANMQMSDDFIMDDVSDQIILRHVGSNVCREIGRSSNA